MNKGFLGGIVRELLGISGNGSGKWGFLSPNLFQRKGQFCAVQWNEFGDKIQVFKNAK